LLFFSGMLRKLDIKNEGDVKSFSRVMVGRRRLRGRSGEGRDSRPEAGGSQE
jgi:hypothetical protein